MTIFFFNIKTHTHTHTLPAVVWGVFSSAAQPSSVFWTLSSSPSHELDWPSSSPLLCSSNCLDLKLSIPSPNLLRLCNASWNDWIFFVCCLSLGQFSEIERCRIKKKTQEKTSQKKKKCKQKKPKQFVSPHFHFFLSHCKYLFVGLCWAVMERSVLLIGAGSINGIVNGLRTEPCWSCPVLS